MKCPIVEEPSKRATSKQIGLEVMRLNDESTPRKSVEIATEVSLIDYIDTRGYSLPIRSFVVNSDSPNLSSLYARNLNFNVSGADHIHSYQS